MRRMIAIMTVVMLTAACGLAFSYNIPKDDCKAKYFYIFGPEGDPYLGAEAEHALVFYIDVPEDTISDLTIAVYDPNTGGKKDYRIAHDNPWDTTTEFAIYGAADKLLDKQQFKEEGFDRKYFHLGPFPKTEGKKIDNFYRFKLDIRCISGDDANLFNLEISPDEARAFTYKTTIRLLPHQGDKMYFYPEIPAGVEHIVVYNWDLDINGGRSELFDRQLKKRYTISDSETGQWAQTVVPIATDQTKRLEYVITKKTQRRGHAGLRVVDDKGNDLPIYFRSAAPGPRIVMAPRVVAPAPLKPKVSPIECRRFKFDATESYDPDKEELTYHWDFGDGTTSTKPVVIHTFKEGGEYAVILTVRDSSGLICDTASSQEKVRVNTQPQAFFTGPDRSCVDEEITFDGSGTTDDTPQRLIYKWEFGDGNTGEGEKITKRYAKAGFYKARLKVNDNEGTTCSVDSMERGVSVYDSPVVGDYKDIEMCIPHDQQYRVQFNFDKAKTVLDRRLSYKWDFGDGATSSSRSTTHIYKKGGIYTAKLTVDDGLGLACSKATGKVNVKLNKQPVANAGEDIICCVNSATSFDGSKSYTEEDEKLSYIWDFGDGTAEKKSAKVEHTYKKAGKFKATLTVDDNKDTKCSTNMDSITVLVNSKPTAAITEVKSACVNTKLDFDASKSKDEDGDSLKYSWEFGDGTVLESSRRVSHTYNKGGEYLVKVTVDDQRQTPCSTDSQSINVRINTPPVADAGPNLVCCINTESFFDGSSSYDADGDSLSYFWDFGDGATAKGAKVTHVYKKIGEYTVTLSVDDNSHTACSLDKDSFSVSVHDKPVPVIKIE